MILFSEFVYGEIGERRMKVIHKQFSKRKGEFIDEKVILIVCE